LPVRERLHFIGARLNPRGLDICLRIGVVSFNEPSHGQTGICCCPRLQADQPGIISGPRAPCDSHCRCTPQLITGTLCGAYPRRPRVSMTSLSSPVPAPFFTARSMTCAGPRFPSAPFDRRGERTFPQGRRHPSSRHHGFTVRSCRSPVLSCRGNRGVWQATSEVPCQILENRAADQQSARIECGFKPQRRA
jgi:hypothetical protein